METADAGMAVVPCGGVVVSDHFIETANEIAHSFRVNRRVLHEGNGLGVAADAHQQAQTALAHVPDHILVGAGEHIDAGVGQAAVFHILL